MKTSHLAIALGLILPLLPNMVLALDLVVVNNYNEAERSEVWKKVKTDQIPPALLSREILNTPISAYQEIFPKTFLQESLFAVCHKTCDAKDIFNVSGNIIREKDLMNWNVVEQSTVYFWLKKYFQFLDDSFFLKPNKFLKVLTNREIEHETEGRNQKNNAFFNPQDTSLSFLPATKNLLFKLTGGKINRSGFDPSVISHEASHFLFHHLFPHAINDEIGGLNEGFADYIANIFLDNPKIGLVMMHGKSIRDSSNEKDSNGNLKTYKPNMEVHDLGERVAYALWKSRELSHDKNEMDKTVIDAIKDLSTDPYSTVHDFKFKMLERLPSVIDDIYMKRISLIWEIALTGEKVKLSHLDFLEYDEETKPLLGFYTKETLPAALAIAYGVPPIAEGSFGVHKIKKISESQTAILISSSKSNTKDPLWVALDTQRNNVLGVFQQKKKLMTGKSELEMAKSVADQAKGLTDLIKDFGSMSSNLSKLSQGQGDLSKAYKVKGISTTSQRLTFNGIKYEGQKIQMKLKKKIIAGLILGLPSIETIELFTLPIKASLPEVNGHQVVGYRILFETGTAKEVILNQLAY